MLKPICGPGGEIAWYDTTTSMLHHVGYAAADGADIAAPRWMHSEPVTFSHDLVLHVDGTITARASSARRTAAAWAGHTFSAMLSCWGHVCLVRSDGVVFYNDVNAPGWIELELASAPVAMVNRNGVVLYLLADGTLAELTLGGASSSRLRPPLWLNVDAVSVSQRRASMLIARDGVTLQFDNESSSPVEHDIDAVAVCAAASWHHPSYLALDRSGTLWGWGGNDDGRLGLGRAKVVREPTACCGDVEELIVGADYTLVRTSDGAWRAAGMLADHPFVLADSDRGEVSLEHSTVTLDRDANWVAYRNVRRLAAFAAVVPTLNKPTWNFVRARPLFGPGARYVSTAGPTPQSAETASSLLDSGMTAQDAVAVADAVMV